jgi:hypothetical protein
MDFNRGRNLSAGRFLCPGNGSGKKDLTGGSQPSAKIKRKGKRKGREEPRVGWFGSRVGPVAALLFFFFLFPSFSFSVFLFPF